MAPHSSTVAWKTPWTEEPGRLQSMRSLRVGHDWETSLSLFTFTHWRRNDNPLQCSCLENPRDGGAWWAAIYGVTQSRTRLKWLSNSRGTRDQIANICWIIEKARESQKKHLLLYWLRQSLWQCGSQQTVGNSSTDGNTRLPYLPPEKSLCRSRSNS